MAENPLDDLKKANIAGECWYCYNSLTPGVEYSLAHALGMSQQELERKNKEENFIVKLCKLLGVHQSRWATSGEQTMWIWVSNHLLQENGRVSDPRDTPKHQVTYGRPEHGTTYKESGKRQHRPNSRYASDESDGSVTEEDKGDENRLKKRKAGAIREIDVAQVSVPGPQSKKKSSTQAPPSSWQQENRPTSRQTQENRDPALQPVARQKVPSGRPSSKAVKGEGPNGTTNESGKASRMNDENVAPYGIPSIQELYSRIQALERQVADVPTQMHELQKKIEDQEAVLSLLLIRLNNPPAPPAPAPAPSPPPVTLPPQLALATSLPPPVPHYTPNPAFSLGTTFRDTSFVLSGIPTTPLVSADTAKILDRFR